MRLLLVGAPGVGKGTQAKRLSNDLRVPHISTGDMFREAIRRETSLGLRCKGFIDFGRLVPDDLTIGLIEDRFSRGDTGRGFILDGFPRTLPQAEALDGLLGRLGQPLDAVVVLEIEGAEVIERITGRRSCPGCGTPYHLRFRPPRVPDVCDLCGTRGLVQRVDDTEAKVRTRLEKYHAETTAVIPYYERKGRVKRVDGRKSPDEVYAAIRAALEAR